MKKNGELVDGTDWFDVLTYLVWAWTILSFIVFLCLYHKIKLAIAVLKAASMFV